MLFFLGVTGTWEGWVPSATDLYLRGNNIAGFSPYNKATTLESGGIMINRGELEIVTSKSYNLTSYTKLNLEMYITSWGTIADTQYLILKVHRTPDDTSTSKIGSVTLNNLSPAVNKTYILSLDIGSASYTTKGLYLSVRGGWRQSDGYSLSSDIYGYCYHIWLS